MSELGQIAGLTGLTCVHATKSCHLHEILFNFRFNNGMWNITFPLLRSQSSYVGATV